MTGLATIPHDQHIPIDHGVSTSGLHHGILALPGRRQALKLQSRCIERLLELGEVCQ